MYLIVTPYKTYQTQSLRSDQNFYGWVLEQNVQIFQWKAHTGDFKRLHISTEEVSSAVPRKYKVLRYTAKWLSVVIEESSEQ